MRIAVVYNPNHEPASRAFDELVAAAQNQTWEIVTGQDELDLIVALGGDGTLLHAVHTYKGTNAPILGIKFGKVGFLSGASCEDVVSAVKQGLRADRFIEERALLHAEVAYCDGTVEVLHALNEVVIGRAPNARVVSTALKINGHHLYTLRGDGMIVATATGSTAYALSAGGPVVSPGYGGMIVVPLASHTLVQRSIVTAPQDEVLLTFPESAKSDVLVSFDGVEVSSHTCELSSLRVVVARETVKLVKLDNRRFYDTVATQFFA